MLRRFRADLHIHTCLSPCGSLSMVPGVIVEEARRKELDVIGICDHNATENVPAVRKAAEKRRIVVLGGMEITSEEEVHVLALFDNDEKLFELQKKVYDNLPGRNDERVFGEQVIVNENDEVVDVNDRLLIGATGLPLQAIVDAIHSLCGLAIASHVDRESFGIIGQLGFIPEGLPLDALEVSPGMSCEKARISLPAWARGGLSADVRSTPGRSAANVPGQGLPGVCGFPVGTFSDAHYPEHIGRRCTAFLVEGVQVEEMRMALLGREGRSVFLAE